MFLEKSTGEKIHALGPAGDGKPLRVRIAVCPRELLEREPSIDAVIEDYLSGEALGLPPVSAASVHELDAWTHDALLTVRLEAPHIRAALHRAAAAQKGA